MPWYEFGEQAVRALVRAGRLGAWRTATAGDDPALPPFDPDPIQELLTTAARDAEGWLAPAAAVRLLDLAGIPHCPSRVVAGPDAAVAAALELGFPAVVKSAAPGLVHKTDVGGVAVGLPDEAAVRRRPSGSSRRPVARRCWCSRWWRHTWSWLPGWCAPRVDWAW